MTTKLLKLFLLKINLPQEACMEQSHFKMRVCLRQRSSLEIFFSKLSPIADGINVVHIESEKEYSQTCRQRPPMAPPKVAVVDCWSLFGGHLCTKCSKWDLRMWSLYTGVCYSKVVVSSGLIVIKF